MKKISKSEFDRLLLRLSELEKTEFDTQGIAKRVDKKLDRLMGHLGVTPEQLASATSCATSAPHVVGTCFGYPHNWVTYSALANGCRCIRCGVVSYWP